MGGQEIEETTQQIVAHNVISFWRCVPPMVDDADDPVALAYHQSIIVELKFKTPQSECPPFSMTCLQPVFGSPLRQE